MTRISFSLAALLIASPFVAAAQEDLAGTYENLQAAEAKKDAAQVKKLAVDAIKMARQVETGKAPDGYDAEAWKEHQQAAKDIETHGEYALFATALTADPAVAVDLFNTLESLSPKSKYLDEGYAYYFVDLEKTGAAAKIPEVAEKAVANFPDNDDALMVLMNEASSKNQSDRALTFGNRLIAAVNKHSKPENVSQADWDRKKTAELSRAYWITGMIYGERNRYLDADRNLRAALPLIKGNDAMMGPALFYLGVANYNLSKMTNSKAKLVEAANFSQQSAAIKWAHADQAYRNWGQMKAEADRMR